MNKEEIKDTLMKFGLPESRSEYYAEQEIIENYSNN